MKTLRKRVTCVNRDDHVKNTAAINKVMQTYIGKMTKKGWYFLEEKAHVCCGNAFFEYEQIFTIYKPNLNNSDDLNFIAESELSSVLLLAKEKGSVSKDGVFVMQKLKEKGWVNLSSVDVKDLHSDLYYDCGYSGSYNFSRLVKKF